MASIAELRALITQTLAAAEDALEPDRPLLMLTVDTMRAEITRRTGDEPDEDEPAGYAIGSDGQVAELAGGAAFLDGETETEP